ncbi:MAG: response regulator [Haliangiales bacterium]
MLLKTKILLVEDDDTIVDLVYAALESAGYQVLRASNGAFGIEMLKLYTPDMMVLDVMMPVMDGIKAAGHIRQDEELSDIPILMLTALGNVDSKVDGFDAGADAYMPKPFDLREFKAQIKALLRGRKRSPMRNPVTGLPGPGVITETVTRALSSDDENSLVVVNLREVDAYVNRAAFAHSKALAKQAGELLQDQLTKSFQFTSFIGHRGGGEFALMLPSDSAENFARDLVARVTADQAALVADDAPLSTVTLDVAVVPLAGISEDSKSELNARLNQTMRVAAANDASSYAMWSPPPDDRGDGGDKSAAE